MPFNATAWLVHIRRGLHNKTVFLRVVDFMTKATATLETKSMTRTFREGLSYS